MLNRPLAVLCVAALCLGTAACSSLGKKDERPAEPVAAAALEGTEWSAGQWPDGAVIERPLTLQVEDGTRAAGFAGVNRYFASVVIARDARASEQRGFAAGTIRFGEVGATKMAGPPEAMRTETRFMEALSRADRYEISGETLTLFRGRDVLIRFSAGPVAERPRERRAAPGR